MSEARKVLLALSLCLGAACGSNDPTGPGNPLPAPDSPNDVDIVVGASGLTTTAFNPNPREVALGGAGTASVRWVNTDGSKTESPRLPFTWDPNPDDEKQRIESLAVKAATGKQVRNETTIQRGATSVGSVAVDLAVGMPLWWALRPR